MNTPTPEDLQRAIRVVRDLQTLNTRLDEHRLIGQLIADVRAEERERGEAERALLAASLKQVDNRRVEFARQMHVLRDTVPGWSERMAAIYNLVTKYEAES